MLKRPVALSLVITLFLSLAMIDQPSTFGDKIDCQKCHERDGKGSKRGKKLGAPDFKGAEWQASVTDEQLIASITIFLPNPLCGNLPACTYSGRKISATVSNRSPPKGR